ncbi:MAG: amidohydrolase [Chryseolinea sp.]
MKYIFFVTALLLANLFAIAQSKKNQADIILINGKVWTSINSTSFVEAIAIQGNQIIQVGKSVDINKLADKNTRVIDLKGRLVIPGFNDAHIHFLNGSLGLSEVELTGADTIEEVLKRITEFAQENPERKWITGRGWQYTMFPGGFPSKELLDKVISDRPIWIRAYDGHSAWVNSKALELAGVTKDFKFDGYGRVLRDANGEATGAVTEEAQFIFSKVIPETSREEKLNALRKGMKLAASLGITTIQNASGSAEEFSLYEELLKNGELTLRTSTAFSVGDFTTKEDIESFTQIKNRIGKNPMINASAIKFMLDGVIESHTGAMLDRYSDVAQDDPSPTGSLALPLDTYRSLVAEFDKRGFQIYTHAIGDKAVREALNAYENAQKINGTKSARHRVEHIETIAPMDMPRFAQLGVLPSMEPIHAEPGTVSVWENAVGEKRLPNSFAWASMLKNKAKLVFSSDWPACVSLNPIRGLHTAVTRKTINGQPPTGWVPEQKISIQDALFAYTYGGAYSSHEENVKGKIASGYYADIVVLSQNLFSIEPMKTHETKVLMTIFNGRIIYQGKDY